MDRGGERAFEPGCRHEQVTFIVNTTEKASMLLKAERLEPNKTIRNQSLPARHL